MFEFTHRHRIVFLVLGAAVAATFASTGCVAHHHYSRGPIVHSVKAPPRSAALGYAHHYGDVVLVFDNSWNGYWVRSHPDHYFHSNHYYRRHGGGWQRARSIRGPWISVQLRALPLGLHRHATLKQRRDGHEQAFRESREEFRAAVKESREQRREIAESRKPRQLAKAPARTTRSSAEHRGRKLRKDEEPPESRRVR